MGKSRFIVRTKNVRKKWLVLIYQIDQESQFIKSFEISEGNTTTNLLSCIHTEDSTSDMGELLCEIAMMGYIL